MKKLFLATILAASLTSAMAVTVGVSTVRDVSLDTTGAQVTLSLDKRGAFTPTLSVANINGMYTQYGIGATYQLTKVGPVMLDASGKLVTQQVVSGQSGYGAVVGVIGTYPLTKAVDLVGGVSRFAGQDRVSQFNGNTTSLGLVAKF